MDGGLFFFSFLEHMNCHGCLTWMHELWVDGWMDGGPKSHVSSIVFLHFQTSYVQMASS